MLSSSGIRDRVASGLQAISAAQLSMAAALVVLVVLMSHLVTSATTRVAGSSGVAPQLFVAEIPATGGTLCQSQRTLPASASALRVTLGTYGRPGPSLKVVARAGRTRLTIGLLAPNWRQGVVRIPLDAARTTLADFQLCFVSKGGARLAFAGEPAAMPADVDGAGQPGRVSVVGETSDAKSLWELRGELATRIGRGNAELIGSWAVYLIAACFAAAAALGGYAIRVTGPSSRSEALPIRSAPRQQRRFGARRLPPAIYALTAAALALGVAWSLLTPPFQVPDETAHVAYVQYLAEAGRLPAEDASTPPFSAQENALLDALGFARIIGRTDEKVLTTSREERALRKVENSAASRDGSNAATASSNPPLYYGLAAGVYLAASGGSLLEQTLAIRLLSVVVTTFAVFLSLLFVRELMPSSPWTWTAAGLACAFQPVLGFIGSGVNPDCMLFACSSGVLYSCIRATRRGLTLPTAVMLAVFVVGGLLTKPLFLALIPAVALTLGWCSVRDRRQAWRPIALAVGLIAAPMAIYLAAASGPLDHPYFANAQNVATTASGAGAVPTSFGREASFIVQQFLPRPPFLTDFVPGFPLRDVWVNGLVGVFGWVDFSFAARYRDLALVGFACMLLLASVALLRQRRRLRTHLAPMLVCVTALVGVLGVIGVTDYQALLTDGARFQQARYLLPLLGLYGGLFALAAKAIGARVGSLVLPWLWVVVTFHSFAAFALTANRYYL